MRRLFAAVLGAAAIAGSAASGQEARVDWGERLRTDAQAAYEALRDNHPGVVDPQNPSFKRRLEAGLRTTLQRAKTAKTEDDWAWGLLRYSAAFDDGHLNIGPRGRPRKVRQWPGFFTTYRGAEQVVAARADDTAPPLGARLLSCDGVPAAKLAEERLGRAYGRWFLESQRRAYGPRMFLDHGDPYAPPPRRCRFESEGRTQDYVLPWRAVTEAALAPYLSSAPKPFRTETGLRTLPDGTAWIGVGSFITGEGNTEKLKALVAEVEANAAAIRAAPRVVLDLRGNDGGSSQWSDDLANLLFGPAFVSHRRVGSEGVDWRVSDANIEHARALKKQIESRGSPAPWMDTLITGLTDARARGATYWRQGGPRAPAPAAESLLKAPVFVLTDGACFSACLDAVDLWKALGAVQVGRETSADTLYMENRGVTLPSKIAGVGLPVKVYRGRKRGNNETHRPEHVYAGDTSDTVAVAAWIATLPVRPARS